MTQVDKRKTYDQAVIDAYTEASDRGAPMRAPGYVPYSEDEAETEFGRDGLLNYEQMAELSGREEQTLRAALRVRNQHVWDEGKARSSDIPPPVAKRWTGAAPELVFAKSEIVDWLLREGKIRVRKDGSYEPVLPAAGLKSARRRGNLAA